jgi:predicted RND superfamily exporter protein
VNHFVERVARLATRFPAAILVTLFTFTVVLGFFAAQQEFDADMTAFTPEGELQQLEERVREEFGGGERQVQVIVDAGRGGDVLSPEGLRVAEVLEDAIVDHDEIGDLLHISGPMSGSGVITYATPLAGQLQQMGMEPGEASQRFIDSALQDVLDGRQGERVTALLSQDFDGETARGGLIIINLDPDAPREEITAAHLALADVMTAADTGFFDAQAFSFSIVQEEMEASMETDLPILMGASFLLIVLILAFQFRKTSDVVLGVLGLMSSVIWMAGFSVLLGPDYLGVTGPFSQIAMAVPVLLVGLGIDYSVHLTSRYREERAAKADAVTSARTAVVTVGVALSLATVTTAIGFMSNMTSPLPPIVDFGIFAAVGIASAAVVLGLLVPAARVLLDRRTDGLARVAAPKEPNQLPGLSVLPARAPLATMLGGVLLAATAGVAATGLDTTFSQEEFIPEGSYADQMLQRLDTLFGGDISERTDVLVDADVRDPEVISRLVDAEYALADVEGVRTVDDRADVTSPASVVREIDQMADAARQQLAAQFAFLEDPDAAAEQMAFPEDLTYGDLPADMRAEIAEGDEELPADEELPVDDLDELERRLPPGVSGTEALLSTLPGAELVDTLRQGIAEQLEQDAPDVDPAIVAELAAIEPDELTAADIRASGYPDAELPEQAMELIEAGDELAAAGWRGDDLAEDADVAAILAVAEEHGGDMLEGVLSDDAALISVSTQAGEEGADRLASDITEVLAPVAEVAPGGIAVISDQLMIDETLTQMTASQIRAIVTSLLAALALLVLYYGISARRPALGIITMIPPLLSVPLILGSMWVVGLSFNAMTATVSSIAIGIGVPYGIHVTNRFLEERKHGLDSSDTITGTLRHTGTALVGSAVTTAAGFGVLMLSDLAPMQQFGGVTSVTILYALVTALLVESSALVLWDRWHRRRAGERDQTPASVDAPRDDDAARDRDMAGEPAVRELVHRQQEGPA